MIPNDFDDFPEDDSYERSEVEIARLRGLLQRAADRLESLRYNDSGSQCWCGLKCQSPKACGKNRALLREIREELKP